MTLEELYAQYGKAVVSLEIAQAQLNEAKRQLAAELNKPKEPKE